MSKPDPDLILQYQDEIEELIHKMLRYYANSTPHLNDYDICINSLSDTHHPLCIKLHKDMGVQLYQHEQNQMKFYEEHGYLPHREFINKLIRTYWLNR